MADFSFADTAVVACGTMSLELNHLQNDGYLDTPHILYTTPGLHQNVRELEPIKSSWSMAENIAMSIPNNRQG